jgi:Transposase DDE domain
LQPPEARPNEVLARLARSTVALVGDVLDSPEVVALIAELDELRWTGRQGYGTRTLIGACLVKALYALPTWTRTTRLIREHRGLRDTIGGAPSEWACYRFCVKLRKENSVLDACLDSISESLRDEVPELGRDVALDGSDLPAYANGQKFVSRGGRERERFSDPDASWGHRSAVSTRKGGGYYGYKLHAAVCVRTGLPLAWEVETAKVSEAKVAVRLLDQLERFAPETASMDKGYDSTTIHDACAFRGIVPIIPLRQTQGVKREPDAAPQCEHGRWTFAGADFKRRATKWRCPSGECEPKSIWVKADRRSPLIPRETKRWRSLYRSRAAVEREFGTLKHFYGLSPLRVRGLERVALHADLVMLARLSQALARARAVPLAA